MIQSSHRVNIRWLRGAHLAGNYDRYPASESCCHMSRELLTRDELNLLLAENLPTEDSSIGDFAPDSLSPETFKDWENLLSAHFAPGAAAWSLLFELKVALGRPAISLVSPALLKDMGAMAMAQTTLQHSVEGALYFLVPTHAARILAGLVPGGYIRSAGFEESERKGYCEAIKYLLVEFRSNLSRTLKIKLGVTQPKIDSSPEQLSPEGQYLVEAKMDLSIGNVWKGPLALWADLNVVLGLTKLGSDRAAPAEIDGDQDEASTQVHVPSTGYQDPSVNAPPFPEPSYARKPRGQERLAGSSGRRGYRPSTEEGFADDNPVPRVPHGRTEALPFSQPEEMPSGTASFDDPSDSQPCESQVAAGPPVVTDHPEILTVELGRGTISPSDGVTGLRLGQVVTLDRLAGESVDLLIAHRLVARGEVVVVGEVLGVKVTQLLNTNMSQDYLASTRHGRTDKRA